MGSSQAAPANLTWLRNSPIAPCNIAPSVRGFKSVNLASAGLKALAHAFTSRRMNPLLYSLFIGINEMGYVPIDPKARPPAFRMAVQPHEKGSVWSEPLELDSLSYEN